MLDFTNDEKSRMFDEIASHFYKQNFGSFSKTDFDLLMFHFYMDKITRESIYDGIVDYRNSSDYRISKDLGITQQKVRNLKVKNQLVYPDNNRNWKEEFAKLVENARLEDNNKKIIISIPDPNLYIEIENYLDEKGSFIEKQLNSKLMVMRIEYFIDLCLLEEGSNKKRVVKEIKECCKEADIDMKKFDDANIGKSLLEITTNTTSIIANISTCFSPGNIIGSALKKLIMN